MQDFVFMDEMAHFDHERIPERVVHAKGAGNLLGYILVYWYSSCMTQNVSNNVSVLDLIKYRLHETYRSL